MDNLDEMNKFLETYNLPKLNQEESENVNRQIIPNEIEAVIRKFPINKSPRLNGFTGRFYQTSQEELTPLLLKLFQTSYLYLKRNRNLLMGSCNMTN